MSSIVSICRPPAVLPETAPQLQRSCNRMLRAQILKLDGKPYTEDESNAFALLREGLLTDLYEHKNQPPTQCLYRPDCLGAQPGTHRPGRWVDGYSALLIAGRWQCGESGY